MKDLRGSFWNRLSGAIAILMTLIFAVIIANNLFNFIPSNYIIVILSDAIYYGGIALVIITMFEVLAKSNVLVKIIFLVIFIFIICYSVSPDFFGLLSWGVFYEIGGFIYNSFFSCFYYSCC